MKIAFLTLGCKLNYAETSTYERGFVAAGLEVARWDEKADVYLINTCSVTERAEKKCRNVIRKVHRVSPEAKIVVTGCYAQLRREELEAIDGVALVFGAAEKTRIVPDTLALLSGSRQGVLPPPEPSRSWPDEPEGRQGVLPPPGLAARGQVSGRGPSLAMGGIYPPGTVHPADSPSDSTEAILE
ncbi:MAG: hypothetical protein IKW89_02020, partial [Bacteroidales bacterium]|nr:hypothetical protein [Bacteroidales bacterium]